MGGIFCQGIERGVILMSDFAWGAWEREDEVVTCLAFLAISISFQ